MEPVIILQFLQSIFLQGDLFGMHQGPLGSADPLVKGIIPSMFGILGFSILLNLFNAVVRRKLVDQEKLQRIMKETRAWQKERMSAFRSKDAEKQAELNKKSAYMTRLNQEMMQMNMRPMMITFVPLILIFYFVLPPLFSYTVALSPVSLNVIPGDFFSLTCPADKIDGKICHNEHDVYFWAWYFLGSIAFSGIIMKLTKTSMDLT